MSDEQLVDGQLWFEENSAYRWPIDTLHHQAERWRAAWNAGLTPDQLRYSCDLGQPPAAEAVPDPRELGFAMHRVRVAPYVAPAEPAKPELPAPSDRDPWPEHLLVALFTKSVRDLRNKSLSEIASKKVPKRITENEIAMALYCTKPNRKSVKKMGLILMSEDATAAAVMAWRLRAQRDADAPYPLPDPSTVASYLETHRPQLAA